MNEFTKDELLIIKDALKELWRNRAHEVSDKILKVWNKTELKVQFLINNYCDHKNLTQDSALVDCCLDCNWVGFKDE